MSRYMVAGTPKSNILFQMIFANFIFCEYLYSLNNGSYTYMKGTYELIRVVGDAWEY